MALTSHWLSVIKREAYRASAVLAGEKGAFPLYDPVMLERPNLTSLDDETRAAIRAHGLRNGCLTSIAPTGTTSLLAGNVSSGIEPVFAFAYSRKVLQPDGSKREEAVEDYALAAWRGLKGDEPPPENAFVTAQDLQPADHLRDAGGRSGPDRRFDLEDHQLPGGHRLRRLRRGLSRRISARVQGPDHLSAERDHRSGADRNARGAAPRAVAASASTALMPRPDRLEGATYKINWPESAHAVYVTINDAVIDGERRPFEIFVNSKNMEHYAWTVGLTRMISAVFRRGGDVSFVR